MTIDKILFTTSAVLLFIFKVIKGLHTKQWQQSFDAFTHNDVDLISPDAGATCDIFPNRANWWSNQALR